MNVNVIKLIEDNLNDKTDPRCLLAIIRGDALLHIVSSKVKIGENDVITIQGSAFESD